MGYCISQKDCSFFLPKENVDAALKAIQSLANNKETITDSSGRHFSWVEQGFEKLTTLKDILEEWRWEPRIDVEGNIWDLVFTGQKYVDDNILFEALAPYIQKGSWIEFLGEDGSLFRFTFDGVSMKEIFAQITWEGY